MSASSSPPRRVAVVGAGPAGLMAAERLALRGASVTVFERMPSVGRKFLLAGRGGLNLTHSEPAVDFMRRYGPAAAARLAPFIDAFSPQGLRDWCEGLGEPTFIGSSGRVFPKSFKASPLLRAWLRRLESAGVRFALRHRLQSMGADGGLQFSTPEGPRSVTADAIVLALGGASWPRLGSDGTWVGMLGEAGAPIAPLRPANCGFRVGWSGTFMERFAGAPIKGAAFSSAFDSARGEAMVTRAGLEGGAIYALASGLRNEIDRSGAAVLRIDLKPEVAAAALAERLSRSRAGDSLTSRLRKIGLPPVAIGLLREAVGRELPKDAPALANLVKALTLRLDAPMPVARAISTAGGVRFDGLDAHLMLEARPGLFVCGEMLDWEAPTGGYLLQACFATGAAAGEGAADWLALSPKPAEP